MVRALTAVLKDAIGRGACAIILRAKGRGFCAGADLKERQTMGVAERLAHNRAINDAVDILATAPVPTIAVINGLALGGGLELALGCDIRIASETAQLGLTEARVGAIPGAGGTQRLPRLIGVSRALEMMYLGEPIAARRAFEIGLVNCCVPDPDLDTVVESYVQTLGSRSPSAASALKKLVLESTGLSLSDGLACEQRVVRVILGSADYAEGLAAFEAKRVPKFSS
jgi:enoyl-CoA hydratase/carnithine racemase